MALQRQIPYVPRGELRLVGSAGEHVETNGIFYGKYGNEFEFESHRKYKLANLPYGVTKYFEFPAVSHTRPQRDAIKMKSCKRSFDGSKVLPVDRSTVEA
jgi:hypothetical protein